MTVRRRLRGLRPLERAVLRAGVVVTTFLFIVDAAQGRVL